MLFVLYHLLLINIIWLCSIDPTIFVILQRRKYIKSFSLQWKDKSHLTQPCLTSLIWNHYSSSFLFLYFRKIMLLLPKVNWCIKALSSFPFLSFKTVLMLPSTLSCFGTFSFSGNFSAFPSVLCPQPWPQWFFLIYKFSLKTKQNPHILSQVHLFSVSTPHSIFFPFLLRK